MKFRYSLAWLICAAMVLTTTCAIAAIHGFDVRAMNATVVHQAERTLVHAGYAVERHALVQAPRLAGLTDMLAENRHLRAALNQCTTPVEALQRIGDQLFVDHAVTYFRWERVMSLAVQRPPSGLTPTASQRSNCATIELNLKKTAPPFGDSPVTSGVLDAIPFSEVASLADVFAERAKRSPNRTAYFDYDASKSDFSPVTWAECAHRAGRIRAALERDGIAHDGKAAMMLRNCSTWCIFDQAAFAHGMVTVPLFVDDRPDNIAYILNDAEVDVILCENDEHIKKLLSVADQLTRIKLILTYKPVKDAGDPRVRHLDEWMSAGPSTQPLYKPDGFDGRKALATIVYTSGTTGKPKGVMLSHRNLLANVDSCIKTYDIYPEDRFLSFLPLSHMFERLVGYYFTMATGSEVSFARSIPQLSEDFRRVQPSVIVSVPRIFERLHAAISDQLKKAPPSKKRLFAYASEVGWERFLWHQGRGGWSPQFLLWPLLQKFVASKLLERLGGRLRLCISGGAALNPTIAQTFLGLGLPICQGYGLTEAAPVCSVNLLHKNDPASIGPALAGIEVALGENNALMVKGDNVMMGYWKRPEDTARVLNSAGWLNTGDQARIDDGFIYITGRIKEIIVMGNGEKVPPVDMELAIQLDSLLEQVMIVGEAKPFLSALVVLNMDEWFKVAEENGLVADPNGENKDRAEKLVAARIAKQIKDFPGYAQVRKVVLITEKWTVDNGLLTPTLKLKRGPIGDRYKKEIDAKYRGHVI